MNHRATTSDHENYPCELRQAYPTKEQTIKYYQPINEDVSLELNAEVKEAQIPRITAETTCGHVNVIVLEPVKLLVFGMHTQSPKEFLP